MIDMSLNVFVNYSIQGAFLVAHVMLFRVLHQCKNPGGWNPNT